MIENIFEFNNITAADVMVHRTEMTAVNIADTVDTILQTIKETGFSRFPVYEDNIDNIVGILSTRNFLLNVCSDNPKKLKELTYEPYFVPESVRADALFSDMQSKNCHMVVVLDEYGGTSGLVTMEDLLEEIVGNIYDETDDKEDEPQIEKIVDIQLADVRARLAKERMTLAITPAAKQLLACLLYTSPSPRDCS